MKVNTIVIGAGRSGTTSLYAYLAAHPEVNFSITKELHYFSIDDLYQRGEKYFHSLFEPVNKKIIATADTYLLMDTVAPERIKNYNPDMKIIVMLRDPVERAYSNYNYSVNYGHEDKNISFLETIQLEKDRLNTVNIVDKNNLCHFYGSLYYKHLQYWEQYFPASSFSMLKLEDLKNDPVSFYKDVCNKLGIAYAPFEKVKTKLNATTGVKSKWMQQLLLNRESGIRKVISFVLRPFRKVLIKSGIVDKIYALNKKEVEQTKLSQEEIEFASRYFKEDMGKLRLKYGITLEKKLPISNQ